MSTEEPEQGPFEMVATRPARFRPGEMITQIDGPFPTKEKANLNAAVAGAQGFDTNVRSAKPAEQAPRPRQAQG